MLGILYAAIYVGTQGEVRDPVAKL